MCEKIKHKFTRFTLLAKMYEKLISHLQYISKVINIPLPLKIVPRVKLELNVKFNLYFM